MYTEEQIYEILGKMDTYGGSFIQALAELYRRADNLNRQKILLMWTEHFEAYHRMGIIDQFPPKFLDKDNSIDILTNLK